MPDVLVVYYSRNGSTARLAQQIARGIDEVEGMSARIRSLPAVSANHEATEPAVPQEGAPFVTAQDLEECVGIAFGSPTRFGNMSAPAKFFLDGLGAQWASGTLLDKPACVFTSTATMHGGQESTLLSMMVPLIHHGCVIVGIPYAEEPRLSSTVSGGTPYGASHVSGPNADPTLTDDEAHLARALGKRLATIARKLA